MHGQLNLSSVLEHPARLTPDRVAITCGPQQLTYARAERQGDAGRRGAPRDGDPRRRSRRAVVPERAVVSDRLLRDPQGRRRGRAAQRAAQAARDRVSPEGQRREGHPRVRGHAELPIGAMCREAAAQAGTAARLRVPGATPASLHARPVGVSPAAPRAARHRRHPVHLRHDGAPQRGGADARQHGRPTPSRATTCSSRRSTAATGAERHAHHAAAVPFDRADGADERRALRRIPRSSCMPRFDPAAVLEAFAREQVGLWIGVPTMYWALLEHARASGADVSGAAASLRVCASGGAPMPVELLRAFEQAFDVAHSRRLRPVRNGAGGVVQPAAAAVEARHGRPADLRRRRAVRRRARQPAAARRARRGRRPRART